jgi:hypothetical protein
VSTKLSFRPPFALHLEDGENDRSNGSNSYLTVTLWNNPNVCRLAILAQEVYECRAKWRFVGQRERELMGHAIECQVAALEGHWLEQYEGEEAMVLHRGYGGLFADQSYEAVLAMLRARRGQAEEWVREHAGEIGRWRGWLA